MPRFLDTNILLRYLTRDDEAKAQACLELLQRLERAEEVAVTSELVIAEAVFTLQSPRQYGLPRESIRQLLEPIITLRGLRLPHKRLLLRALDLYCEHNLSFTDAFNAAVMEAQGITGVYSYDSDFDRVPGIERLEPPGGISGGDYQLRKEPL